MSILEMVSKEELEFMKVKMRKMLHYDLKKFLNLTNNKLTNLNK